MHTDDSSLLRRRPFLACFLLWLATAPGMLVGTTLIFVVPLLLYGLYLLRGSGKPGSAFPPWQ